MQLARDPLVLLQVVRLEDGGEAARADEVEQHEAAGVGPVTQRAGLVHDARLRQRGAVAQLLAHGVELLQQLQLAEVLVRLALELLLDGDQLEPLALEQRGARVRLLELRRVLGDGGLEAGQLLVLFRGDGRGHR